MGRRYSKRPCTEDSTCVKARSEEAQHNLEEEAVWWAATKVVKGKVMGDKVGGLSWSKRVKIKGLYARLKIRFFIIWDEGSLLKGRDVTRYMFGKYLQQKTEYRP